MCEDSGTHAAARIHVRRTRTASVSLKEEHPVILSRLAAALVVGSGVLTAGTLYAVVDPSAPADAVLATPAPAACHATSVEKTARPNSGCCRAAARAAKVSGAKAPCGTAAAVCSAKCVSAKVVKTACCEASTACSACPTTACSADCPEQCCVTQACCPTAACAETCDEKNCCGTDRCEADCCEEGCCDDSASPVADVRSAAADFCGVCGTAVKDAIDTVGCSLFKGLTEYTGCNVVRVEAFSDWETARSGACGPTAGCCEDACCESACCEDACCGAPAAPGESAEVFGLPTVAKVIDFAELLRDVAPAGRELELCGGEVGGCGTAGPCCGSPAATAFDLALPCSVGAGDARIFSFSVGVTRNGPTCSVTKSSCPKETCCEPKAAAVGFCDLLSAACACGESCSCDPCGCGSSGVPASVASLIRKVAGFTPPAPAVAPVPTPARAVVIRTASQIAPESVAKPAMPAGTWTRTLNDQSVTLTLSETGFEGRCTIAHSGCAVRFAGDCSVTADGLLYGVITSAVSEPCGPAGADAARRMEVEMVCRTLIDQPVSVRVRSNGDAMTVTDAKFAGIGIVGTPAPGDAAFLYQMLLTGQYTAGGTAPAKFVAEQPAVPVVR